jgi:hypothetical protein
MKKIRIFTGLVYLIWSLFLILPSCNLEDIIVDNEISGKGTITKTGDDFILTTNTGLPYVPTNLPDDFKIDGLRVEFRGIIHENPNQFGIDKIEFTYINKLD